MAKYEMFEKGRYGRGRRKNEVEDGLCSCSHVPLNYRTSRAITFVLTEIS